MEETPSLRRETRVKRPTFGIPFRLHSVDPT